MLQRTMRKEHPVNNIIRALSIHEASFPVYAQLCPGAGNIVACLHLTGELSAEQAGEAFAALMIQEQSLQVANKWFDSDAEAGIKAGYYFVKPDVSAPYFSRSNDELKGYDQQVLHFTNTMLNQPFQEGGLLWRAHLLSQTTDTEQKHCLILCVNHGLADGATINQLLKQWLGLLRNPVTLPALQSHLNLPLWHYMPKRISGFLGAFRSLGIFSDFLKGQKLADNGLSFAVHNNVPVAEHRCISTFRTLEKSKMSALLTLAKAHNKSVHGLLSAAFIGAFLADCKNRNQLNSIKNKFTFPFVTTVNVRDKMHNTGSDHQQVSAVANGCFSSGVVSMVNVDIDQIDNEYKQSPWALGQQVSAGVETALKQDQHWKVLRIYQLAGLKGLKKMFMDASEKPLATPLSLANLGAISFEKEGTDVLTIEAYQVYAAFHASGAGLNLTASSLNGVLNLCITAPAPVISQLTLDRYADDVIALLGFWAATK